MYCAISYGLRARENDMREHINLPSRKVLPHFRPRWEEAICSGHGVQGPRPWSLSSGETLVDGGPGGERLLHRCGPGRTALVSMKWPWGSWGSRDAPPSGDATAERCHGAPDGPLPKPRAKPARLSKGALAGAPYQALGERRQCRNRWKRRASLGPALGDATGDGKSPLPRWFCITKHILRTG